jgi:hypothetical protein
MKNKIIAVLILIIILLIAAIGLLYNLGQQDLKNKNKELDISYSRTQVVMNELDAVRNDLAAANAKNVDLTAELDSVKADLEDANTIIGALKDEKYGVKYVVSNEEINMIARTVWGEARGLNTFEQSMVIWCILNRVDDGTWGNTIAEVITYANQFHGYSRNHPITDEMKALAEDVVARWQMEKHCNGNIGRTLPSQYLYFHAESGHNVFTVHWAATGRHYDWSNCWNPYS